MTFNFKTNPLYLNLKDKLKTKYKNNFEDKDDYINIYHKSMTFVVEPYDEDANSFYLIGALNNIELYNGDTQVYNNNFTLDDWLIKTEEDVDEFLYEFNFMVLDTDADKRCVRIMKAIDKLHEMVGYNNFDREFVVEYFHSVFGMY